VEEIPFLKVVPIFALCSLLCAPAVPAWAIFPWPVASATAETAAYVVWTTDVGGSSQVNYGTTANYGSSTTLDPTLVTHHAQTITGLLPNMTYHYQVASADSNGNMVGSGDYTFTTLTAPTGTVKTVKPTGGDYTSIQACANAASAGWTCEVYAGNGDTAIISVGASHGGSAGNPVTFIAHDAVLVPGFSISSGASYVTMKGFEVSTTAFPAYQSCSENDAFTLNTPNANYITIASNYIHNIYDGSFIRYTIGSTTNHDQILNNVMAFTDITNTNPPYNHPCNTSGEGWIGIQLDGDYNLIDGNDGKEADHWIEVAGKYNAFRRNVFHDTHAADWGSDPTVRHVDFFHPGNTTASGGAHDIHSVIENNQDYNRNDPDAHFLLDEAYLDQNNQNIGTGDGTSTTFSGTLSLSNADGSDTGIAPFSVDVIVGTLPGMVSAIDDGFGHMVNPPSQSNVSGGTINYTSGAISVTFSSAPASGAAITAYYALNNLTAHDLICRFNLAQMTGGGFGFAGEGGTSGVRFYNTTLYEIGYNGTSSQQQSQAWGLGGYDSIDPTPHWTVMNTIYYNAWIYQDGAPWGSVAGSNPPAQVPGYGLAFTPSCDPTPGCAYTSSTQNAPGMILSLDPLLANPAAYNFSLQAGSPALAKGTYLTTVASTDSGSGTVLIVSDAGFFQDGYGIPGVNADCIAVTNVTNHVCITAVNYQTNILTLASSITRSAGDPVWLYSDSTGRTVLSGSAPDIGDSPIWSPAPAPPQPPPPPGNVSGPPFTPRAYPNPWRADRGYAQQITFDQLTGKTTVKIFTVSGHLVRTLSTQSSGLSTVSWDLTNDSGDRVASGIYIYLATNDQGQQARGKVAVIR
jgi:hypothetical protein